MRIVTALFCLLVVGLSACRSSLADNAKVGGRRTFYVEVQNGEQVVNMVADCCARLDVTRMETKTIRQTAWTSTVWIEVEFRSTRQEDITAAKACISRLQNVKTVK
ncbi:hypothetical protein [Flavihumibacter petaseus]|uniref:Uncharacterized protein n=1 Tax=Flavihumibacter petaseus NBRC 106054 TaxID=1220578 RepID=A0A0E9MZ59_9BACT|nr:hypothetical protein [Flavihumibacter petaseus]GAO43022.1 hypothetical protein FPE01S_02_01270 [Flavihumibacter petaseus NBRC 106054]